MEFDETGQRDYFVEREIKIRSFHFLISTKRPPMFDKLMINPIGKNAQDKKYFYA